VSGHRLLAAAIAAILAAIATPPLARATDGYNLTGLRVEDGASWHASNPFFVRWDPNPQGSESVVHWFVRAADGRPLGSPILGEDPKNYGGTKVQVPAVPGVYVFEANDWGTPTVGPLATVPLYFDNARPGPVSIEAPAWVAPGTAIPIRLSAPAGPLPISGIHGYALSIDQAAAGSPCVAPDRCATAEIDLPGGIEDDATTLRAPPEGVAYIHAGAVSMSGMRSTTATRSIGVDGTPPQVRLEGAPADWSDGPVRLTYRQDEVRVEQASLRGTDTDFRVSGSARFAGDRALNLRLDGAVSLQLLSGFVPQLEAGGRAQINAAVAGTLSTPRVNGKAHIDGASFRYGDFPAGLSNLAGDFNFDAARMAFENVVAESGGGHLTLGGAVSYGEGPLNYTLNVRSDQVRIRYPVGMSWLVAGTLRLSGNAQAATLSGRIVVDRLLMAEGFDLAGFMVSSKEPLSGPRST